MELLKETSFIHSSSVNVWVWVMVDPGTLDGKVVVP